MYFKSDIINFVHTKVHSMARHGGAFLYLNTLEAESGQPLGTQSQHGLYREFKDSHSYTVPYPKTNTHGSSQVPCITQFQIKLMRLSNYH